MVNLSSSRPRSQRRAGARFVRRRRRAACNPGKITSSPVVVVKGADVGGARPTCREGSSGSNNGPMPSASLVCSRSFSAGSGWAGERAPCIGTGCSEKTLRTMTVLLPTQAVSVVQSGHRCWTDADSAVCRDWRLYLGTLDVGLFVCRRHETQLVPE